MTSFQPHLSAIIAVYAFLLAFGVVYNGLVAWLEQHKALEGFMWAAVAVGVAVVLGGLAIFSWQFALLGLGAFGCAGLPMVGGSIVRYVVARKAAQDAMRKNV